MSFNSKYNKDDSLVNVILSEMSMDGEDKSDRLKAYYQDANSKDKKTINDIFMFITGWTLDTLISRDFTGE